MLVRSQDKIRRHMDNRPLRGRLSMWRRILSWLRTTCPGSVLPARDDGDSHAALPLAMASRVLPDVEARIDSRVLGRGGHLETQPLAACRVREFQLERVQRYTAVLQGFARSIPEISQERSAETGHRNA